jgi:biotin carboxylase
MSELILLAHVPTDSVNEGFLPAARALGLSVVLLTDQAEAHRQHFGGCELAAYPDAVVSCDVFNPIAVIEAITRRGKKPAAIFSNSDHLQTSTAIAADYFGLPSKDWRVAYRAKNKAEMRSVLKSKGIDPLWHATAWDEGGLARLASEAPFPCVAKPREGVASLEVGLVRSASELEQHCRMLWKSQLGQAVLLEEYIEGPLYTLETLGDGQDLRVLGGFRVVLSPPPHFIELEACWNETRSLPWLREVCDQIRGFGIGFGACHTEFVATPQGPRLIEINYRCIGDQRDFLLQEILGIPLFETVLRLYLGESLPALESPARSAEIRYFPAEREGRLMKAPQGFTQREEGVHLAFRPLRRTGDTITLSHSNKDYLGVLSAVGPKAELVRRAMDRAAASLAWEFQP